VATIAQRLLLSQIQQHILKSELFTGWHAGARGVDIRCLKGILSMNSLLMTRPVLVALLALIATCNAVMAGDRDPQRGLRGSTYDYGPRGPNHSYQADPRTRIYVTKRSWLDGGTEVLPGERKFSDYAFPPGYSFARDNNNRPLDRQPLNPASDLGGFTQRIPVSW